MVVDQQIPRLDDDQVDRMFQALADATRRDIVVRVLDGEWSVSELARQYPMSFAAVQKHVAVLERADLIVKERRGREQIVRTNIATVRRAAELLGRIESIWRGRMQQIDDLLAEPAISADTPPAT